MENNFTYASVLSKKALKEIAVSWSWYEERLQYLGDRFVEEVKKTIIKIEENPHRYATKYKSYRQASVDTFPFLVIFRITERKKIVRIVSVFHTSRNPDKKY